MRIYVAGSYNSDNVLGVLNNIHAGIKKCAELLKQGHDVFCPWLDYQFHFFDNTLQKEDYQRNSMAWLEVSEEVWVMPNSEKSGGTQREIARARELNIPVRYL
jgi:hypothetical protein